MENLTIRRLKPEDAQSVAELVCRNFYEVNIKDYPADVMQKLADSYTPDKILSIAGYAHSYVACLDQVVVGCGSIAPFWGKEDESILLTIFVLPEYQGMGIGREIIKALENDMHFLQARRIEIPSSITACSFYRKLGYDYKNGIEELDEEGLYRLEKFRTLMDLVAEDSVAPKSAATDPGADPHEG